MTKLLKAYQANPTYKNAQKVRAYDRAHPMGALICPELDDLRATAIAHANRGE